MDELPEDVVTTEDVVRRIVALELRVAHLQVQVRALNAEVAELEVQRSLGDLR